MFFVKLLPKAAIAAAPPMQAKNSTNLASFSEKSSLGQTIINAQIVTTKNQIILESSPDSHLLLSAISNMKRRLGESQESLKI